MASTSLADALSGYYSAQQRNAYDTYSIGLAQNKDAKAMSDLSYQQKLDALQDTLNQQQDTLPDKFAARGLMNSGIWNYNGAGQMGAKQQFAYDKALSQSNLAAQNQSLDTQYNDKANELGLQYQDAMSGIAATQLADNARQAISDAIAGA